MHPDSPLPPPYLSFMKSMFEKYRSEGKNKDDGGKEKSKALLSKDMDSECTWAPSRLCDVNYEAQSLDSFPHAELGGQCLPCRLFGILSKAKS